MFKMVIHFSTVNKKEWTKIWLEINFGQVKWAERVLWYTLAREDGGNTRICDVLSFSPSSPAYTSSLEGIGK